MSLPVCFLTLLLAAAAIPPSRPPARPAERPGAASSSYPSAEALAHYAQARLAEERREDVDALAEYYRVLASDPRSLSASRGVSNLAARQGEAARSLEFADRALAIDPGDAASLWLKGSALFNLGRGAEALETLEQATRADTSQGDYWLTLARVAEHQDRIPIVARAYRRLVTLDEDNAEAWFQLAAAEARLARYGAADSALGRAIELNPARPGQLFLRGWIRESTGHRGEAITLYLRHLELHPDDQVTRARLVEVLERERRYREAYDEARRVTRARPGDLDALEAEADLAFKLGLEREGAAALDRMRQAAPGDPATVSRAMSVLSRNGRGRDALPLAETWARTRASDYRGEMLIAQAYAADHNPDSALAHAARAVEAAPDSLAPRILLGHVYQDSKRYADAERVWVETVRRYPEIGGVGLDLAYCREQRGDLDGAERAAREVLKRHPDDPTALNFLGYLFADHDRNLVEAEQLVTRALDQEPDNGAFLDSLGWVYYRLGRLAEARVRLERAAELTSDPVVHEHLGDVYKDLKLFELARDQYNRSLARDSTNLRVRAKLSEIR